MGINKLSFSLFLAAGLNEWLWATRTFEIFSDAVLKGRLTVQGTAAPKVYRERHDLERLWHCLFTLSLCDSATWLAWVRVSEWLCLYMFVCLRVAFIWWNDCWQKSSLRNVLLTVTHRDLHDHHNQLTSYHIAKTWVEMSLWWVDFKGNRWAE